MAYDHNEKAGNQGDVVKHVALIAALDTVLQGLKGPEFNYADTFAGYAYSPLVQDNEWKTGIGKIICDDQQLRQTHVDQLQQNPHTRLWLEWYLTGRPQLLGSVYPGSSLIVQDMCCHHKKTPKLSLWDISPSAIANLMETFRGLGYGIHPRPAVANDDAIRNAGFVFVDPPSATMTRKRGKPFWPDLIGLLHDDHQCFAVWLPVDVRIVRGEDGEPDQEIENTKPQRDDALVKGLGVTVVRWRGGIRNVGCQLFYRLPDDAKDAVRSAIDHIVDVMKWQDALSPDVQAVTHQG